MKRKQKACRAPSVMKCLSCTRPECDVISGVPMDRSEIMAEINAGVLPLKALWQHDRRQGLRKKMTCHCRIESEA